MAFLGSPSRHEELYGMRTSRRNTTHRSKVHPSVALGAVSLAALTGSLAFGFQDENAIGRMSDRLDTLERDNALLREEVQVLRGEEQADWLTEERSTEIRSLVNDVLADSANRTSLQESAAMAGWSSDLGFYLRSADNRFLLQVGGLLQARYMWSTTSSAGYTNAGPQGNPVRLPNDSYGFDLPHSRLVFKGHVFEPGIRYFIRTEFAPIGTKVPVGQAVNNIDSFGGLNLLDAYVAFDLDNQWSVRFGQFKLPFSRERLVSVQNLLAADRSSVDQLMGVGRSQGIELSMQGNDLSWAFAFSDGGTDNLLAGNSNNSRYYPAGTDPINSPYWDQQATFAFTTRLEYKLSGDWSEFSEMTSPIGEQSGILLGLAGHYQMASAPSDLPTASTQPPSYRGGGNNEWINVTADASFNFGGASLFAAVYYSNTETKWSQADGGNFNTAKQLVSGTTNLLGLMLQGSMYVAPKWEVFARYQYIDPITQPTLNALASSGNIGAPKFSPLNIATLGANWYIDGQDLRWSFQLGYSLNEVTEISATNDNGFRPLSGATNEFVIMTQFQMQF